MDIRLLKKIRKRFTWRYDKETNLFVIVDIYKKNSYFLRETINLGDTLVEAEYFGYHENMGYWRRRQKRKHMVGYRDNLKFVLTGEKN